MTEEELKRIGELYYSIDSIGGILGISPEHTNKWRDLWRSEIGNVFKTPEEAAFAVEKLKVLVELKKYTSPYDNTRQNYFIFYNIEGNELCVDEELLDSVDMGQFYFESEEKAEQAIDEIGENRLKKYIFEVM